MGPGGPGEDPVPLNVGPGGPSEDPVPPGACRIVPSSFYSNSKREIKVNSDANKKKQTGKFGARVGRFPAGAIGHSDLREQVLASF